MERRNTTTRWNLWVALLIVIAAVRVIATYHALSVTTDEPAHIASGLQWIDRGAYSYELQHPPIARVLIALGPYLNGARSQGERDMHTEGNAILISDNNYWTRLALARAGNLPFLVLGAVVVWLWGRRWFGAQAGFWAVLLFLSVPPVLAHAGIAALDMAATASCGLALYQLIRWREDPTMRRAIWLSVAAGLALLCKFSVPLFLVACTILGLFGLRRGESPKLQFTAVLRQAAAGVAIIMAMVLLAYRFRSQPMVTPEESQYFARGAGMLLGNNPMVLKTANFFADIPLPFGGLLRGFADVAAHNTRGHVAFLLGKYSKTGFWDFFPVALAVKTPLGFLILALMGLGMVFFHFRASPWQHRVTALFPLAILLVGMNAQINIGLRHILPIYIPLAVLAGQSAAWLFARKKTAWLAVALAGWAVVSSLAAHPDYLPYFNEFGGSHPERILVDSDLDWGQDLDRLSHRLRELNVQQVGIKYAGTARLDVAGLPPYTLIDPNKVTEGYVAISLQSLQTGYAKEHDWAWLHDRTPIERVGKSIDLYYVNK